MSPSDKHLKRLYQEVLGQLSHPGLPWVTLLMFLSLALLQTALAYGHPGMMTYQLYSRPVSNTVGPAMTSSGGCWQQNPGSKGT